MMPINQPPQGLLSIEDIPGPWPSLPFLGTTWLYLPIIGRYRLEALHDANRDKNARYGRICKEEFKWRHPFLNLFDPVHFKELLKCQGRCPFRPPNEASELFRLKHPELYGNSPGLVNASGEEWQRLRRGLTPFLMQSSIVQAYLPAQAQLCKDFLNVLRRLRQSDGTVQDIMPLLHRSALESALMFCLDIRLGCLEAVDPTSADPSDAKLMIDSSLALFKAYQELYYGTPLWRIFPTAAYKQMENAELALHSTVSKYIDQQVSMMKEMGITEHSNHSLLQHLLSSTSLTATDVQTGVVDFITAGIDTSANTIAFALYHLGKNAACQETLRKEIQVVLADKEVSKEAVMEMPYLKACVKESYRLTPTIPNVVRVTSEDLILDNYLIPKGTTVCCQTMVTSRLPEYVSRPDEFLPERWLDSVWKGEKIDPHVVMPFGFGMRLCPGRRFAEQEIYLTLISILRNFRIEFEGELKVNYMFIVTPQSPLKFRFLDL